MLTVWHKRLVFKKMKQSSTNEVAGATNWSNLTDYLKIERGVNDPCKLT